MLYKKQKSNDKQIPYDVSNLVNVLATLKDILYGEEFYGFLIALPKYIGKEELELYLLLLESNEKFSSGRKITSYIKNTCLPFRENANNETKRLKYISNFQEEHISKTKNALIRRLLDANLLERKSPQKRGEKIRIEPWIPPVEYIIGRNFDSIKIMKDDIIETKWDTLLMTRFLRIHLNKEEINKYTVIEKIEEELIEKTETEKRQYLIGEINKTFLKLKLPTPGALWTKMHLNTKLDIGFEDPLPKILEDLGIYSKDWELSEEESLLKLDQAIRDLEKFNKTINKLSKEKSVNKGGLKDEKRKTSRKISPKRER